MMKMKTWSKPEINVVQFAANEYISACRDDQGNLLYELVCELYNLWWSGNVTAFFTDFYNPGEFDSGDTDTWDNATGDTAPEKMDYISGQNYQYDVQIDHSLFTGHGNSSETYYVAENEIYNGFAREAGSYSPVYLWWTKDKPNENANDHSSKGDILHAATTRDVGHS